MVIGAGKSGKTSLVNAINDYHGRLRKTQDMIFGKYKFVDRKSVV